MLKEALAGRVGREGIPVVHSEGSLVGAWAPRVTSGGVQGLNCTRRVYAAGIHSRMHKEKLSKKWPFFHSNRAHKHSPRPTFHSQASKMNGRDKHTDCQQQRNNTWLPPPQRIHKEQEVLQIAQKIFAGKILSPRRNFPCEIVPSRNFLPLLLQSIAMDIATTVFVNRKMHAI